MKKNILSALAICAALLGCQKNEISEPSFSGVDLHATIEDDASTKTVMDENNNIRWSEEDQVVAFMKTSLGLRYQIKKEYIGKTSGYFSQVSSGSSSDIGAGTEWDHNVVYYPYSDAVEAEKSGDDYALNVILPSEQTYAAESFGNGSMAMVAVSENNNITFRNILGGMKLQLRGTQKVKSIKLEGKNNEKLSGAATVTAYTDETKPAITMASGASTSVTLDCGSGVQLNESTSIEFIIALPPVLFSRGFTVTVTDADSKTYTVETDKANTVLRSSILNMPAFKLGETPDSETPENAVDMIVFDIDKLTVVPGTTYALTVDFEPFDAPDKTLVWNSSNPSVASVDASGVVKAQADGTSTITAVAVGGANATCTVKVISCIAPTADYIDEYGVNHGKGIAVGNTVWAPVNCGYKAATSESKGFPYGKLYQWGRKYGQGYFTSYDASVPEIVEGPISAINGQKDIYSNTFFTASESPNDWTSPQDDNLWNSGTAANPVKTEYDPCPEGWRVPTYAELGRLNNSYSSFMTVGDQKGRYFCGDYTYLDNAPQVFFPAAGRRNYYDGSDGSAGSRGDRGGYWSSRPGSGSAYCLYFLSSFVNMKLNSRAYGYSVRCVQDNSPSVPEQEVELVCVMMNNENGTKSIGFDNANLYLTGDDFVDVNGVDYPIEGNGTKTFVVKVPKADSYTVSYPADAVKVNTDGTYSVNIPDEYVGSSFGVFIGKVADESLQCNLVAICGIVRLDVSAYVDWDRMEFESICGSAMWGNAVLLSDYSVHAISEGESIVTVKRSGDDQYMFMPILPASVNGIAVTMYNKAGDILIERRFVKALTFERGMIYAFERL